MKRTQNPHFIFQIDQIKDRFIAPCKIFVKWSKPKIPQKIHYEMNVYIKSMKRMLHPHFIFQITNEKSIHRYICGRHGKRIGISSCLLLGHMKISTKRAEAQQFPESR